MKNNAPYKSPALKAKALASYDKQLSQWPQPFETNYITTTYGKTFVISSKKSQAPTLVLIHGGGGNSSMWRLNWAELSEHFNLYAIDIIGEAGKSAGERHDYQSEDYAMWLDEVLQQLGLDTVNLLGASLGGLLAQQYALAFPQKIASLILLAPPTLSKMRLAFILKAILAYALPFTPFIKSFLRYISHKGPVMPKPLLQAFVTQVKAFNPNTLKIPLISDEELKKLPPKTMILIGRDEVMYAPVAVAKRIERVAPHIKVQLVDHAKHTISLDQPRQFRALVTEFSSAS